MNHSIMEQPPRNDAPSGKQWFSADTTFVLKGVFEVIAENEEEARKLVEEKCGMRAPDITTLVSLDQIEWRFPMLSTMVVGEIKPVEEGE